MTAHLYHLPAAVPLPFYDIAAEHMRRTKEQEKKLREANKAKEARGRRSERRGEVQVEREEGRVEEREEGGGEEGWEEAGEGGVEDFAPAEGGGGDDWEEVDPHLGGEVGAAVLGVEEEEEEQEEEETYEEMVARRVHDYVTRGQQQVLSSTCTCTSFTCTTNSTCTTTCTCTPGAELGADPASGGLARQHRAQAGGRGAQEVLRHTRLWWVLHLYLHLYLHLHLQLHLHLHLCQAPTSWRPCLSTGRGRGWSSPG